MQTNSIFQGILCCLLLLLGELIQKSFLFLPFLAFEMLMMLCAFAGAITLAVVGGFKHS